MRSKKITIADFARDPMLTAHANQSKAVARALDEKAESLPYSKVFTSLEFEDFLSQLTPKRFELLRIASKGRLPTWPVPPIATPVLCRGMYPSCRHWGC